jgi:hypothetical protein
MLRLWQDPIFYVLVVPVVLSGSWALTGMILEHKALWRRCSRALIGAFALADVSFVVSLMIITSHRHGCPFNGCS